MMKLVTFLIVLVAAHTTKAAWDHTEAVPSSCLSDLATCTYYARWAASGSTVDFEIAATSATGVQWLGIGFSTDTSMPGTDAILGWVNGGTVVIEDTTAGTYDGAVIDSDQTAITNKAGTVSGNTMTLTFTRTKTGGGSPNLDISSGVKLAVGLFATGGRPSAGAAFTSSHKHTSDKFYTSTTFSFDETATTTTTAVTTTTTAATGTTTVTGSFTISGPTSTDIDASVLAATLTEVFKYPTTVTVTDNNGVVVAAYTSTVPTSEASSVKQAISNSISDGSVLSALKTADSTTYSEASITNNDGSGSNESVAIAAGAGVGGGLAIAVLVFVSISRGARNSS